MGMASLDACAGRGLRVIGLEQHAPLHDLGSSHGRSRIIRRGYFEGAFYVPLLERSYTLWHDLEAAAGRRFMTICGGVFAGPPTGEVVAETLAAANAYDVKVQVMESAGFNSRFPQFRLPDHHVAVYEPGAGYINPDEVAPFLADRAGTAGAAICQDIGPVSVRQMDDGTYSLTWGAEEVRANRVILTPGPWASEIFDQLGLVPNIQPERVTLHWFDAEGKTELFTGDGAPVGVWELDGPSPDAGHMFYGFPLVEGDEGLKFGFHTGHRKATDMSRIDRAVEAEEIAAVTTAFRALLPDLQGRHLRAKTCIYSSTPDSHFAVGPVDGCEGLYFAGGFSGHGYKFSLLIGEVMATLAAGEQPEWDLTAFSPSRILRKTE